MKQSHEEIHKKWAQVIAKAWMDPQFKKALLANPEKVLKENGVSIEKNKTCRIVEVQKNELCFVLPQKPEGALSESELKNVAAAGGVGLSWYC